MTTKTSAAKPTDLSPAMRQYAQQKEQVGDAILLFRMGDFYETFYDDAVTAARVLGIALTSRNKNSDQPIPLAGIPYHALDGYLRKLVAAGLKVAISEQLEDAKQAKGVVKRDVVRIVTAGTLTEDALLDEKAENVLAAICLEGASVGIAAVELAGGSFTVSETTIEAAIDDLVRIAPAELIIADDRHGPAEEIARRLVEIHAAAIARRSAHEFSAYNAEQSLHEHFRVTTLEGFGFGRMTLSLRAGGVVLNYLRETQRTGLDHITTIRRRESDHYVKIDRNTWRSLEIDRTLRTGQREGSLLDAIDRTVHPMGARRLRDWICMPLTDTDEIIRRQDAVAAFVADDDLRRDLRTPLRGMADVERITGRVALLRVSPRELASLAAALGRLPQIRDLLAGVSAALVAETIEAISGLDDLAALLENAIHPDAPHVLRDGGVIADGYHPELDRLRTLRDDSRAFLARYQRELIDATGIPSLKVAYNKVFGYYIEIPNTHRDRTPPEFIRRQTVKNAERYITDRLKQYEDEVLSAADRALALETQLFEDLRQKVAARLKPLQLAAGAVGLLDAAAALGELAVERRYCRPRIVEGGALSIVEGRHPVLDTILRDDFIPNDTRLDCGSRRVIVITGPNMAGKSTYVRQVALLALLAQTGSFVPADDMELSPVDRVFARVGASDEIARGQSTFMVEMTEAAVILNTATNRSLVVLDEIGRGTSTFDGLALAWAITEHLANRVRCRSLVATHYHELTALPDLLEGVHNCCVAVREHEDPAGHDSSIVFLHKIVEGRTDRSYGIHVARMAGVPRGVIDRSRVLLEELHDRFARQSKTSELAHSRTKKSDQLELFPDPADEILARLRALDPETLTPLQALQELANLRQRLNP